MHVAPPCPARGPSAPSTGLGLCWSGWPASWGTAKLSGLGSVCPAERPWAAFWLVAISGSDSPCAEVVGVDDQFASAGLTTAFGLSPDGALGALPYLLAAGALDATALVPWLRERAWPVVVLAAPVHLVALLVPLSSSLLAGVTPAALTQGLAMPALLHLCFGAGAGLLGLALATAWRSAGPVPW